MSQEVQGTFLGANDLNCTWASPPGHFQCCEACPLWLSVLRCISSLPLLIRFRTLRNLFIPPRAAVKLPWVFYGPDALVWILRSAPETAGTYNLGP